MIGLNSTLSIASGAISADSGALAVTNNNIANVNTPGYSRQIVTLSAEGLASGSSVQDNGVSFGGYTSVRDEVLQIGINQKTSDAGGLDAQSTLWSQIETGFSCMTSGVGASLSSFFSDLSALSTSPNDPASRQAALSSAGRLVTSFHQAAETLSDAATQANQGVASTVTQINGLSQRIAALDSQLAITQATGQEGGSVEDQRNALTTQLAQLTGITSTSSSGTPSLSTSNGSPLVIHGNAYPLQITQGTDGVAHVLDSQGKDITAALTGGSLGGALYMRDKEIPQLNSTLNQFASDFATAVNSAQTQGYDQSGASGQALFTVPTGGTGAAAGMALATPSSSALAISSDGSAGSSGNLSNLLSVQTQTLPSGQNPTDAYAALVESIGNAASETVDTLQVTTSALNQLTSQQASESGVSIDEETTNLMRYQQAYEAAAKVISTVDQLYSTLMNMSYRA